MVTDSPKKRKGIWVDNGLLGLGLSPLDKLLYSQIIYYSESNGFCVKSDKEFGLELEVSERAITSSLSFLVEKGLLTKYTNRARGNYRELQPSAKSAEPLPQKVLNPSAKSAELYKEETIIKQLKEQYKEENEKENSTPPTDFENPVPDFVKDEQQKKIKVFAPPVAVAPPQLEEIENEMRNSMFLEESGRRTNKISEAEYREAMELFFLETRGIGKVVKSDSEHRRHFLSWLRIHAQKNKNNPDAPKKGKIQNNWEAAQAAKARLGT